MKITVMRDTYSSQWHTSYFYGQRVALYTRIKLGINGYFTNTPKTLKLKRRFKLYRHCPETLRQNLICNQCYAMKVQLARVPHWNKKTPVHILQMSIKSIAYLIQHSFGYFSRILAIFDISGFSLSTIHELKPLIERFTLYTNCLING